MTTDNELKLSHNKDEELKFAEYNISIPLLSPQCYKMAYRLKPSNVVMLLDKFIKSSKELDHFNYLDCLDMLFENRWVANQFAILKDVFANRILYNILLENPNWLKEVEKIGLRIEVPVTGIDKIDDSILSIKIKNFDIAQAKLEDNAKYVFISEKYIEYCMNNPKRFLNRFKEHSEFLKQLE